MLWQSMIHYDKTVNLFKPLISSGGVQYRTANGEREDHEWEVMAKIHKNRQRNDLFPKNKTYLAPFFSTGYDPIWWDGLFKPLGGSWGVQDGERHDYEWTAFVMGKMKKKHHTSHQRKRRATYVHAGCMSTIGTIFFFVCFCWLVVISCPSELCV